MDVKRSAPDHPTILEELRHEFKLFLVRGLAPKRGSNAASLTLQPLHWTKLRAPSLVFGSFGKYENASLGCDMFFIAASDLLFCDKDIIASGCFLSPIGFLGEYVSHHLLLNKRVLREDAL